MRKDDAMIKLFYGNEPYCLNSEKKKIRESVERMSLQTVSEWNQEQTKAAFQVPFLSEKNVILLELEKLTANNELLSYLNDPSDMTDLYIFARQVDRNTKVYKEIKARFEVVECNKVSAELMKKWVYKQLAQHNAEITNNAYRLFMERVCYWADENCDLYVVKNYILQMAAYGDVITEPVVKEIVPETVDEKVFALSGYLLNRQGKKMMRAAVNLLSEKESAISMLSAMLRTFRLAYKACLLKDVKGRALDSMLGAPSYQYAKAVPLGPAVLKRMMDMIQDAVNSIKCGRPEDKVFILTLGQLLQIVNFKEEEQC